MTNSALKDLKISEENIREYAEIFNKASSADIAEVIASMPPHEQMMIFDRLAPQKAVTTFEFLPFRVQKSILNSLPSHRVATLLNALSPDDRTSLLSDLPPDLMHQLLKYLSPEERAISTKLLGYPENSVGRLMTPDYIAIKMDWTVKQVLDYVREKGQDRETINVVYAIDDNGVLVDDFRIREFLFASLDTKVSELADYKFIALNVEDDEEKALNVFRKYNRLALPVIDSKGVLLGIVTIDDIIEIAVKEGTEDFHKIGGIQNLNESYMHIPLIELIKKRVGWLIVLFIGELMTATAMSHFEEEIAKAIVLTLFVPLIISSGGNAGSQASTLIIRALALGEVTLADWYKVFRREIIAGIVLGCSLGAIGFFRITLWSTFSDVYGAHWLLLAFTIFFSLIGVVLWGSLTGALFPLILSRLGFDPAVSSAPFVATLVDVTGLIIYFSIAIVILQGTLL